MAGLDPALPRMAGEPGVAAPATVGGSGPSSAKGSRGSTIVRRPSQRSASWAPEAADDLAFEGEEDEEPAVRFGTMPDDFAFDDAEAADEEGFDDEGLDEGLDEEMDEGGASLPPRYSSARNGEETVPAERFERHPERPTGYDLTSADTPPADLDSLARSYGGAGAGVAVAPRPAEGVSRAAQRVAVESAPALAPGVERRPVASCTFHYAAGMPDYIEAENIKDPVLGKYIGEYGMRVSDKNNALHDNPDEVIALEVWLYDKLDQRDNLNTTRVLLSEYADDHGLAQAFVKERDGNIHTFVARPGTHFTLDGRNLVVEGAIREAEYDRDGIYRSVKVTMEVFAQK